MASDRTFHQHAAYWAEMFAARILARDNLHLSPKHVSRAAALRLKRGIAALEAYLRRLLFLLALQLEHGLKPDTHERPIYALKPRKYQTRTCFKSFPNRGIEQDVSTFFAASKWRARRAPKPVPLAPLLRRLRDVRALLADPMARARRLAYHLSRQRPGLCFAPGPAGAVRGRDGTDLSANYVALGHAIGEASRARPPPLGPVKRPPPRIRML